jgi:tetratricopeptide (TPR) repeat protein
MIPWISQSSLRSRWYRLPVCLFFFAILNPAQAESDARRWNTLMLHNDSVSSHIEAVRVAEKFGEDDPRLHIALHGAGVTLSWRNNNLPLAESFFKRDIAILEKLDINFPAIASDCYEWANVCEAQGKYKEAEPLLLRALAIREAWKDVQADDPYNAELYCSLYVAHYMQGQIELAADAQARMLKALELWHTDKIRALCLFKLDNNILRFILRAKDLPPEKKRHLLEMTLGFAKESSLYYKKGAREYDYVLSLQGIADIYRLLGNLSEAEQLERKSLLLAENKLDSMHKTAFFALAKLAHILMAQNRSGEVEQMVDEYLSKAARLFGGETIDYAEEVKMCAEIYGNESRPDLEEKRRKQAQLIMDKLKKH